MPAKLSLLGEVPQDIESARPVVSRLNKYKIDFNSVDWDVPATGVRQKAVKQNNNKFRFLEFSRNFIELEWCTKSHIGYILDGQLEIDFSGSAVVYNPGDVITIPDGDNHRHKAKSITETVTIFVVENE